MKLLSIVARRWAVVLPVVIAGLVITAWLSTSLSGAYTLSGTFVIRDNAPQIAAQAPDVADLLNRNATQKLVTASGGTADYRVDAGDNRTLTISAWGRSSSVKKTLAAVADQLNSAVTEAGLPAGSIRLTTNLDDVKPTTVGNTSIAVAAATMHMNPGDSDTSAATRLLAVALGSQSIREKVTAAGGTQEYQVNVDGRRDITFVIKGRSSESVRQTAQTLLDSARPAMEVASRDLDLKADTLVAEPLAQYNTPSQDLTTLWPALSGMILGSLILGVLAALLAEAMLSQRKPEAATEDSESLDDELSTDLLVPASEMLRSPTAPVVVDDAPLPGTVSQNVGHQITDQPDDQQDHSSHYDESEKVDVRTGSDSVVVNTSSELTNTGDSAGDSQHGIISNLQQAETEAESTDNSVSTAVSHVEGRPDQLTSGPSFTDQRTAKILPEVTSVAEPTAPVVADTSSESDDSADGKLSFVLGSDPDHTPRPAQGLGANVGDAPMLERAVARSAASTGAGEVEGSPQSQARGVSDEEMTDGDAADDVSVGYVDPSRQAAIIGSAHDESEVDNVDLSATDNLTVEKHAEAEQQAESVPLAEESADAEVSSSDVVVSAEAATIGADSASMAADDVVDDSAVTSEADLGIDNVTSADAAYIGATFAAHNAVIGVKKKLTLHTEPPKQPQPVFGVPTPLAQDAAATGAQFAVPPVSKAAQTPAAAPTRLVRDEVDEFGEAGQVYDEAAASDAVISDDDPDEDGYPTRAPDNGIRYQPTCQPYGVIDHNADRPEGYDVETSVAAHVFITEFFTSGVKIDRPGVDEPVTSQLEVVDVRSMDTKPATGSTVVELPQGAIVPALGSRLPGRPDWMRLRTVSAARQNATTDDSVAYVGSDSVDHGSAEFRDQPFGASEAGREDISPELADRASKTAELMEKRLRDQNESSVRPSR